jgi:hypothetical protein
MGFVEDLNQIYDQAGGSLCETDSELYLSYLDKDTAEQERLTKKVYREFWLTPEGEELQRLSIDNRATLNRLMQVFGDRFGESSPLYLFKLRDVARDLIRADAIAAPVPKPAPIIKREPTEAEQHAALVEQIGRDMEDPTVPSVTITARRKSSVAYEKAFQDANTPESAPPKPEAPSEVKSFAHLLNAVIAEQGVPKPAAGFYTLEVSGKKYKYPVARFRELADAAAAHGLID